MEALIKSKDCHRKMNLNRRKAIHEKCLNCACWHPWKVTNCTFIECPLHPFRTGKGKQDTKLRSQAIRTYCLWCMNKQVGEVTKCPSKNCPLFIYRKGGLEKAINTPSFKKFDYIDSNLRINTTKVRIIL